MVERIKALRAARILLMAAKAGGGDRDALHRVWLHTSYELDVLLDPHMIEREVRV